MLTVEQVAVRLNIKTSTVRARILRRKIAYCKMGGRLVRIPSSEVERIISQGTVPVREVAHHANT
jgi:excisionase family DNA binding protein